jgi:hypothetical protein
MGKDHGVIFRKKKKRRKRQSIKEQVMNLVFPVLGRCGRKLQKKVLKAFSRFVLLSMTKAIMKKIRDRTKHISKCADDGRLTYKHWNEGREGKEEPEGSRTGAVSLGF